MTEQLRIEYALAMEEGVGAEHGLGGAALEQLQDAFEQALSGVMTRVDSGELGFWRLPQDTAPLAEVQGIVDAVDPAITDVLVLGIGGSSLGARALVHGLSDALSASGVHVPGRRLHLPDNSDPWLLQALLGHLDPKKTLALVISKSGGTVETAAQLLCVRQWFESALSAEALSAHLIAVTDPEKGTLRALANELGLPALSIPGNVGGRFSVLTACGLLPAALSGLDTKGLLAGAAAMAERCESKPLTENPAGLLAVLKVEHARRFDHRMHVLMPYCDALRPFAAWYVQLWAESLGKRIDRQGKVVHCGPTPLPAVGATDQHAQVQLFVEGPRDKLVTFVAVDEIGSDLTIPESQGDLSYLGGKTMGQLLDAERRGTALALARGGRPSLTVHLPRLDAFHLGELFFLYEAATAFAGELYDINAFDQPGVEAGKHLAFGLLGRDGFEAQRDEVHQNEAARPSRYRVL